jgi:hypothetical protein
LWGVRDAIGTETDAFGIDNRGRIVGVYDTADGRTHGYLREVDGRFRTIDVPGAYATVATRINDRGHVVGTFEKPRPAARALQAGAAPMARLAGLIRSVPDVAVAAGPPRGRTAI